MKAKTGKGRIDWLITLAPFVLIMALAGYLFLFPEQANGVIAQVRFFFGDTLGVYYLIIGVGVLAVSLFLAFSKYGNASPNFSSRRRMPPTLFTATGLSGWSSAARP